MQQQTISADGLIASAEINTHYNNCDTETSLHFFVWNDLVLKDFGKPTYIRVFKYLTTFVDYLASGAFLRIANQAWRFSLYFLYPAFMFAVFVGLGLLASQLINRYLQTNLNAIVTVAVTATITWALLKVSGRRWFVLHLMDLWSFSRSYLRGNRADVAAHIDRFAKAVVERYRLGADDEIVLVGHSTGGALILDIAATALAMDPNFGKDKAVTILTVGSTALKIGLHPAAKRFREQVQTLVDAESIQWVEYQAHTDLVNFYRSDPVAAMKLRNKRDEAFPKVCIVRIRDMLQAEAYKRFKYNIFRVHYQYIMANTKRYRYDFFKMCCGELRLVESLQQAEESDLISCANSQNFLTDYQTMKPAA